MVRMKGITPIISIIVLLLIMVALAGAAWTYISGFTSAYTSKVIDLPPGSSYFDSKNIKIMVRNIGTSVINTGSCTTSGDTVTCGDITIIREGSAYDVDIRPGAASISPKGSITITDYNCQAGNVKYIISSPSSTYQIDVSADKPCSYPADPVSWWKFDGDAKDSVGGNHGTINGATPFNDAVRGQVLSFDGVDDYVNVGNDMSLHPSSQISVEAWIFTNSPAEQTVIAGYSGWKGYYLLSGRFSIYNGTTGSAADAGYALDIGKWTHVVGTYDGATVKVYEDGILQGSASYPGPIANSGIDVIIGKAAHYNGVYLNGTIDDVMIFNRALSPEEIKALYNSQKK